MRSATKSSRRRLLAGLAITGKDPAPAYYLKIGRTAMACRFEVFLRPEDREFVPAAHRALAEVDRLEAQMSVYRDSSEVALLNRTAFVAPVEVEERLYGLLRLARQIGGETGGAFDITAGPLIRAWGFFERRGRVPEPEALERARALTGWDKLGFDDCKRAVRFSREGMEVNLASIGKGYALDRAAALLVRQGLRNFLMHAGHSSIVAAGASHAGPGWEVSIRDPRDHQRSLGSVRLIDRAMSTSGVSEQSFAAGGRRYGHILDPRTGAPAPNAGLVSVVAPEAARAEALSTSFFVMAPEEVRRYCEAHPEVASIVVGGPAQERDHGSPAEPVKIVTWGISLEPSEAGGGCVTTFGTRD
ncbi:MAG: FAD:protein FMN transferase [Acidobacteria bacterium]|nr:MAG: FAD:protein FMN transferase [Acidobacteriota bacterium]